MVSGSDILSGMVGTGFNNVPDTAGSSSRDRRLQYWRSCPGCDVHTEQHGWIMLGPVMGPNTAVAFVEFQNGKHATPLPQYGQYLAGKSANLKYDITEPSQRFRPIIEEGGINEFPLDQMVAYNWHRYEVMRRVRPELSLVEDIRCQHGCSNRLFTQESHYRDHISVMHKEVAQPEAIGRQFKEAIERLGAQQNNGGSLTVEQITAIGIAIAQALKGENEGSISPKKT